MRTAKACRQGGTHRMVVPAAFRADLVLPGSCVRLFLPPGAAPAAAPPAPAPATLWRLWCVARVSSKSKEAAGGRAEKQGARPHRCCSANAANTSSDSGSNTCAAVSGAAAARPARRVSPGPGCCACRCCCRAAATATRVLTVCLALRWAEHGIHLVRAKGAETRRRRRDSRLQGHTRTVSAAAPPPSVAARLAPRPGVVIKCGRA